MVSVADWPLVSDVALIEVVAPPVAATGSVIVSVPLPMLVIV